jgi:hypothetical protein
VKKEYGAIIHQLGTRLNELAEERDQIEVRRNELDIEITNLKVILSKLHLLLGQPEKFEDLSTLGFTDAIRNVLETCSGAEISAVQVRDMLASRGFDLSQYGNPMASIYKILTRLKESKEIDSETRGNNVFYMSNNMNNPRTRDRRRNKQALERKRMADLDVLSLKKEIEAMDEKK